MRHTPIASQPEIPVFLEKARALRQRLHAMADTARRLLGTAGSLLPGPCALCGSSGRHVVCAPCRRGFFGKLSHRCDRCGIGLPALDCTVRNPGAADAHDAVAAAAVRHPELSADVEHRCDRCQIDPPAYDATVVAVDYTAPVDQVALALKFGGRLALAPFCADAILEALLAPGGQRYALPDHITMVPLGPARLRGRGFNQSLEIARPLAKALGIPLAPRLLMRPRDTTAQSTLAPEERRLNISGALLRNPRDRLDLRGRHVGVVDDVMTTGETLNEVARVLKEFGAARVTNLVFARTPLN